MSLRKDYEAVIEEAKKQGFEARKITKNSNKVLLLAPDGVGKVMCAATPSDRRSINNLISELRKVGFRWKGR